MKRRSPGLSRIFMSIKSIHKMGFPLRVTTTERTITPRCHCIDAVSNLVLVQSSPIPKSRRRKQYSMSCFQSRNHTNIVFTYCRRHFGALYEKRDQSTPTSLRLPGAAMGGLAEAAAAGLILLVFVFVLFCDQVRLAFCQHPSVQRAE